MLSLSDCYGFLINAKAVLIAASSEADNCEGFQHDEDADREDGGGGMEDERGEVGLVAVVRSCCIIVKNVNRQKSVDEVLL